MNVHLSQITPSIFTSLGLSTSEDLLAIGPSPSGRELLFLIDGFGADVIEKYGEAMPTISRLTKFSTLNTSFPSTTATSLATLMTGELPGVHGMLGYTVQVPRSGGRILNALKWDERVDPMNWQPVPTLFERAVAQNINVTHVAAKRYENSGFTRAVFRGATYRGANVAADLIAETKAALQKTPSFVYLYVNDLDAAGHSDGGVVQAPTRGSHPFRILCSACLVTRSQHRRLTRIAWGSGYATGAKDVFRHRRRELRE